MKSEICHYFIRLTIYTIKKQYKTKIHILPYNWYTFTFIIYLFFYRGLGPKVKLRLHIDISFWLSPARSSNSFHLSWGVLSILQNQDSLEVEGQQCTALFILHCNTAALLIILLIFYYSSTQHAAPQVHFFAVPQCSSWSRDRNLSTASHCNHRP